MLIFIFSRRGGKAGKAARKTAAQPKRQKGWIYCLTNPSLPGMVKIGYTTGSVEARMAQLDGTATPAPFALAGKWHSRDVVGDEKRAHKKLAKHRVRTNREFFNLDAKSAISVISDTLDKPTHARRWRNQRNGLAQGFVGVLIIVGVIWAITVL